jgi:hypothetical protein
MWSPLFNERFVEAYKESPSLHYPALWYDIGPDTHVSRYKLIKLRADLFMEYVKIMADWCSEHKIELTGHMWEETLTNPSSAMGDLMKVFKYQHIPGLDSIFTYGHVSSAIKLLSSAAYNWDRPLVMSETYGGFKYGEEMKEIFYKEAMNQYAKGVNYMVPHALFYTGDPDHLPPELSYYGPHKEELPRYNDYIGRLNMLLQGGRHIADIAVLYPIVDLQSVFNFAVPNDRCHPEYSNYMEISEMLSLDIKQDFTYLHPEVLLDKCVINEENKTLKMNNEVNYEEYKVLILPAMHAIDVDSLHKIKAFYEMGGKVIAIGQLPSIAAEAGQSKEILSLVESMFSHEHPFERTNTKGGRTWHLNELSKEKLETCLLEAIGQLDIAFGELPDFVGGNLSYIHKYKDDKHVFFIANSSDNSVETKIVLKSAKTPELWNPHTGEIKVPEYEIIKDGNAEGVSISIALEATQSLFIVG